MRSEDESLGAQQRKHNITVPGLVYSDYLDPALDTEMAGVMSHYYGWSTQHGPGFAHHFRNVPHEVVLDLLEDLRNVADLRGANGESQMAFTMRQTMDRIQTVLKR